MDVQFGRHFAGRRCLRFPSISYPPVVFLSHLGRHPVDMVDRGWKKADGSPALNPDLWAQALEQEARHKITYVWVKGHAGHPENERCDQLAVAQSKAHGGRQGT